MVRSIPLDNFNSALKLAARDSESRVRRPESIVVKSISSVASYNYMQIIKLCKKYGYL